MDREKATPAEWDRACKENRNEFLVIVAVVSMLILAFLYFVVIRAHEENDAECDSFAASVDMTLPANKMTYDLCKRRLR